MPESLPWHLEDTPGELVEASAYTGQLES